MSTQSLLQEKSDYKYGFSTEVETDSLPKGLSEEEKHLFAQLQDLKKQ